jgi:hypothetical protein
MHSLLNLSFDFLFDGVEVKASIFFDWSWNRNLGSGNGFRGNLSFFSFLNVLVSAVTKINFENETLTCGYGFGLLNCLG